MLRIFVLKSFICHTSSTKTANIIKITSDASATATRFVPYSRDHNTKKNT